MNSVNFDSYVNAINYSNQTENFGSSVSDQVKSDLNNIQQRLEQYMDLYLYYKESPSPSRLNELQNLISQIQEKIEQLKQAATDAHDSDALNLAEQMSWRIPHDGTTLLEPLNADIISANIDKYLGETTTPVLYDLDIISRLLSQYGTLFELYKSDQKTSLSAFVELKNMMKNLEEQGELLYVDGIASGTQKPIEIAELILMCTFSGDPTTLLQPESVELIEDKIYAYEHEYGNGTN